MMYWLRDMTPRVTTVMVVVGLHTAQASLLTVFQSGCADLLRLMCFNKLTVT